MYKILENSNLLDVTYGLICHQTNCIGVMGGGIALAIRNKWPKVYEDYKKECNIFINSNPEYLLGHIQDIVIDNNLVVVNCFGQVYPGNNAVMTDYDAWDKILDKLKDECLFYNLPLHIPYKIGCGLAGGDWNVMEAKFKKMFANSSIDCYVHKFE